MIMMMIIIIITIIIIIIIPWMLYKQYLVGLRISSVMTCAWQ